MEWRTAGVRGATKVLEQRARQFILVVRQLIDEMMQRFFGGHASLEIFVIKAQQACGGSELRCWGGAARELGYHEGLPYEIEIKLRLPAGVLEMRRKLRRLGYRVTRRRALETNILFDNPRDSFGKRGQLLRVRRVAGQAVLTYKGPSRMGRFKKRHEMEMLLPDSAVFEKILVEIGYLAAYRYEKFRTEFVRRPEAGKIMLDETPAGNFLELEGSPRWIDRTARELGFSRSAYITSSYGYLHMLHCREQGVQCGDMLFDNRGTPEARRTKRP